MPNFKTDPNSFGSAFTMRGTTLPGPFQQVAPKTGVRDVDEVTTNKTETYAAKGAGPTESSPIEQHGSTKGKYKTHGVPGGPGSPLEQKLWEKGGIKKQIIDPIVKVGGALASAEIGRQILGKAISKTKWANQPASQTLIGKAFDKLPSHRVIGTVGAVGAGYLAGKAAKGILNWANRGIRNVLVTGKRTGTSEFKSKWGLKKGGGAATPDYGINVDWKGHKGGEGQGELSKKTRKEKGIKVDFK